MSDRLIDLGNGFRTVRGSLRIERYGMKDASFEPIAAGLVMHHLLLREDENGTHYRGFLGFGRPLLALGPGSGPGLEMSLNLIVELAESEIYHIEALEAAAQLRRAIFARVRTHVSIHCRKAPIERM